MISNELIEKVSKARSEGKSIGLVQGSWDLFHVGHLKYLLKAKGLCDFLIVAMDSDEKIKKRKGPSRPIIPEDERKEMLELLSSLGLSDYVVVKDLNEPKWSLIKAIKPDVLVAIKENYSEEQVRELENICGRVAILPRQSESSTSDKIRKATLASRKEQSRKVSSKVLEAIEETKKRIGYSEDMSEAVKLLYENMKYSTDPGCPVCVGCYYNGEWNFGTNQVDFSLSNYDIENRTELFYGTTEHAEINLLKKLGDVPILDVPIWTSLFPCDKCMKVLIDKGVREIYYMEDHPDRNWSKRSHALAEKNGVKTISLLEKDNQLLINKNVDMSKFKYIYPPNARHQSQLDIMMSMESKGIDPMDPNYVNQDILYMTDYWFISPNRFPYEGAEHQILVVSRYPIYRIEDMSEEMWLDLQNIWLDLEEEYNLSGGALCFRFGDQSLSGASLKRIHCHIIVPKQDEKVRFGIGGRRSLKKDLYFRSNIDEK